MNEHRLLFLIPKSIREIHVPTAKRIRADWLALGLEATADLLTDDGWSVWETREVWSARGFSSIAAGGESDGGGSSREPDPDDHRPMNTDRTGEAALKKPDDSLPMFRRTLNRFAEGLTIWDGDPQARHLVKRLIDHGIRLDQLCASATPTVPNADTRRRLDLDADPGCSHCARFGHWSPPVTEHPSSVSGNLLEPMLLCRWCRDMTRRHGCLPSTKLHEAWRTGDQATVRRLNSRVS